MEIPEDNSQQKAVSTWRYQLGLVLFFGAFPVFFATPIIIPMLGLSAGESAALIGGILLAVEVLWLASIPLLGKRGFKEVKQKAFGWLRLAPGSISRGRHRFGVGLLLGSVLIDVVLNLFMVGSDLLVAGSDSSTTPILGLTFRAQATLYVSIQLLTFIGIVAALFILGADFWERLKKAFEWQPGESTPE